jgi:hypothetical protein
MADYHVRATSAEYESMKRVTQERGISMLELIGERILGVAAVEEIRRRNTPGIKEIIREERLPELSREQPILRRLGPIPA